MARNLMKKLEFNNREDLNTFLEDEKGEMYEIIWKAIDSAVARNSDVAYIVEIYLEEESVFVDMVSDREEWPNSLELALKYYAGAEEYEKCAKIKRLLDKIKT